MPYYDFRCAGCGAAFELHLPIERRDDASCPTCGSARVRRAMPAVHAIVRGGARDAAAGQAGCRGEGGTGACSCGSCGCGCGGCGCG